MYLVAHLQLEAGNSRTTYHSNGMLGCMVSIAKMFNIICVSVDWIPQYTQETVGHSEKHSENQAPVTSLDGARSIKIIYLVIYLFTYQEAIPPNWFSFDT